jgi:hypothetical protein
MVAWSTVRLPADPGAMSPGGVSEIRDLIGHDYGDLTHIRVPAGGVSAPAWLEVAEFFYVWAGWGQLCACAVSTKTLSNSGRERAQVCCRVRHSITAPRPVQRPQGLA